MLRARAALAVGILVVLLAFAWGTENGTSTTVDGQHVDCGPAISASWLVSGTPGGAPAGSPCRPVIQRAQAGVLSTMAAGALLALVGWTAHREPRVRARPEVATDR